MYRVRLSLSETVEVASLRAASDACRAYIKERDLGASGWFGGGVYDQSGVAVARVSYNGRIWHPDGSGSEILPDADPHADFVATMALYRRKYVTPKLCPESWDRLWNDISHAYARERLSDNEFDDLLNRFHKEVHS